MCCAPSDWNYAQIRRALHQIPETGFREFKTQRYLLDYIETLPKEHLEVKSWRTGLLVLVRGIAPKRRFGYRTDIDGLPIAEETGLDYQSKHPGYMHACGHDFHMTIALGLLTHFVMQRIQDDLVFIFQPAEEGPGGALPMLTSAELQPWMPDQIVALHVAPEYPVGTIAVRPGIFFANVSELSITLHGTGGHAAYPHLANDMVVAACQLVGQLHTIVSRNINPLEGGVITVGKIEGGVRQNVIAEKVHLEGTIRALSQSVMEAMRARIMAVVHGIEIAFECKAEIDFGSQYCQVWNDEILTGEFMEWLRNRSDVTLFACKETMAGEDFGYFLHKIPGFMFWLGVETPYALHHAKLQPDERAIPIAITVVADYFRWKSDF